MNLQKRIEEDLRAALKASEQLKLSALRMAQSAIHNKEIQLLKKETGLSDEEVVEVLKGEVKKVVGLDVDPAVVGNKDLDEAHVITDKFTIADASIDVAWADYVLEHIEKPEVFLGEVYRVLKPGGSFFFRTPNIFNYVSIISRFTPHGVHSLLANRARGLAKEAHEPYKTFYRLNSGRSLAKYAKSAGFSGVALQYVECEPNYLMFHAVPFCVGVAYERLVNSCEALKHLRSNIYGRFEK